jgi:CheY-specific phosphatase CheX
VQLVVQPEGVPPDPFDGVLSVIGLTGSMKGDGALICSAKTACDLSSHFLMAECTQVDEQVLDVMGEITRRIVGGFKTLLETHLRRQRATCAKW